MRRMVEFLHGAHEESLRRKRRQRRFFRRLPDDGIATNKGERGIPRPDRNRKIESGNNSDGAGRMPLLHHAMAGTFRRDGEAVKLARETDREIADVDHLLHFAEPFLQDLAVLECDEATQRLFVRTQFLAEQTNQFATARCRHLAPDMECMHACRDLRLDRFRTIEIDTSDFGAIDGGMDNVFAGRGVNTELRKKILRVHWRLLLSYPGGRVEVCERSETNFGEGNASTITPPRNSSSRFARRGISTLPQWEGGISPKRSTGRSGWRGSRTAWPLPDARSL